MTDREGILRELERERSRWCDLVEKTTTEHTRNQAIGATMAIDRFSDWLKAQPVPEASELVKGAREKAAEQRRHGWHGDAYDFDCLANALEAETAKTARYQAALEWYAAGNHLLAVENPVHGLIEMGVRDFGEQARKALEDAGKGEGG